MKRVTFLLMLTTLVMLNIRGQVTIGSGVEPEVGALLDLNEAQTTNKDLSDKGLLLPRVELTSINHLLSGQTSHVAGMVVYNRKTNTTNQDAAKWVYPGFYYNDGTKWLRMEARNSNWFYMPSIPIPTQYKDGETEIEIDLYAEYLKQFEGSSPSQFKSSPSAPSPISAIPGKEDIFYYITKYDNSVFDIVSLDEQGKLVYKIKDDGVVSDSTIMNIVFLLK